MTEIMSMSILAVNIFFGCCEEWVVVWVTREQSGLHLIKVVGPLKKTKKWYQKFNNYYKKLRFHHTETNHQTKIKTYISPHQNFQKF